MVGVSIVLKGVSLHEYHGLLVKVLGPDPDIEDLPDAAHAHIAGSSEGDVCIFEVWETKRDFLNFWEEQIEPVRMRLGINAQARINFFQVEDAMYRHFTLEDDEDDEEEVVEASPPQDYTAPQE
jgi:hypothetical protein